MRRPLLASLIVIAALGLSVPTTSFAQAAAPAVVSAADAAPFIGNWNLNLDSPMGPMMMMAMLKVDAGKVAAEVSSDQMGKSPVSELAKQGTNLTLFYSFDYQGQQIPAALTLSSVGDKVNVNLDIAGGAFVATGTATKAAAAPAK